MNEEIFPQLNNNRIWMVWMCHGKDQRPENILSQGKSGAKVWNRVRFGYKSVKSDFRVMQSRSDGK